MMLPYLALKNRQNVAVAQKFMTKDGIKSEAGVPIFFYGTLQNHKLLTRLLNDQVPTKSIVLHGFELKMDKSYPFLEKNPKAKVEGVQAMVRQKDKKILDRWESRYNRVMITDAKTGKKMWAYSLKKIILL